MVSPRTGDDPRGAVRSPSVVTGKAQRKEVADGAEISGQRDEETDVTATVTSDNDDRQGA